MWFLFLYWHSEIVCKEAQLDREFLADGNMTTHLQKSQGGGDEEGTNMVQITSCPKSIITIGIFE